jgi:hypothetical protein
MLTKWCNYAQELLIKLAILTNNSSKIKIFQLIYCSFLFGFRQLAIRYILLRFLINFKNVSIESDI